VKRTKTCIPLGLSLIVVRMFRELRVVRNYDASVASLADLSELPEMQVAAFVQLSWPCYVLAIQSLRLSLRLYETETVILTRWA
jgi:hypothetical protein